MSKISFFYLTKEEIIPWSIPDSWWTLRWWRWVCTRLDRILMVLLTEKSWKSTWCVFGKGSVGSKIHTWNWGEGGVVAGERFFSGFKLFRLILLTLCRNTPSQGNYILIITLTVRILTCAPPVARGTGGQRGRPWSKRRRRRWRPARHSISPPFIFTIVPQVEILNHSTSRQCTCV